MVGDGHPATSWYQPVVVGIRPKRRQPFFRGFAPSVECLRQLLPPGVAINRNIWQEAEILLSLRAAKLNHIEGLKMFVYGQAELIQQAGTNVGFYGKNDLGR